MMSAWNHAGNNMDNIDNSRQKHTSIFPSMKDNKTIKHPSEAPQWQDVSLSQRDHSQKLDSSCLICGAFVLDSEAAGLCIVSAHEETKCPIRRDKRELLSALDRIDGQLVHHSLEDIVVSTDLQRLCLRKGVIQFCLKQLGTDIGAVASNDVSTSAKKRKLIENEHTEDWSMYTTNQNAAEFLFSPSAYPPDRLPRQSPRRKKPTNQHRSPVSHFDAQSQITVMTASSSVKPRNTFVFNQPGFSNNNNDTLSALHINSSYVQDDSSRMGDDMSETEYYHQFIASLYNQNPPGTPSFFDDEKDYLLYGDDDDEDPLEEDSGEFDISPEELNDLFNEEGNELLIPKAPAPEQSYSEMFSKEDQVRLVKQIKANFQLLVQNSVIENEMFPTGKKGKMFWEAQVKEFVSVFSKTSETDLYFIPHLSQAAKTIDNMKQFKTDYNFQTIFKTIDSGENKNIQASVQKLLDKHGYPPSIQAMNRAFEKEFEIDLAYKIEAPSKGMQKKKFFRDVEDNLLYIGVSEFGTTNTDSIVHNLLPHRSAKQCAVRYKNLAAGRGKDERFKELQAAVLNNFSITEQIILLKAMKEYREDFRLIQQKVFPTKPPSYLAKVWLILNERRAKGTQNQNDKYAIENYEFKPMNVLKSGTHHSNAQE